MTLAHPNPLRNPPNSTFCLFTFTLRLAGAWIIFCSTASSRCLLLFLFSFFSILQLWIPRIQTGENLLKLDHLEEVKVVTRFP
jgi:hypothetical protein